MTEVKQYRIECDNPDCKLQDTITTADDATEAEEVFEGVLDWQFTEDGNTYCPEHHI